MTCYVTASMDSKSSNCLRLCGAKFAVCKAQYVTVGPFPMTSEVKL